MRYTRIFQYSYLAFAIIFLFDSISKWNDGTHGSYISLGLAALAVFMFFFRRKFNKKFDDKNNS